MSVVISIAVAIGSWLEDRHRGQTIAVIEPHQDHAAGGAAGPLGDAVDRRAYDDAVGGDHHQLFVALDDPRPGDRPGLGGGLDGADAADATTLDRVGAERGALAVALLGHNE